MHGVSIVCPELELVLRRHVSALLVSYRKGHRVNQAKLAAQLGISQSHLSKIESNIADLSTAPFLRFCTLAKINPSALIDADQFEGFYRGWLALLPNRGISNPSTRSPELA